MITNNDREILKLDDPSAETITELCGTKQPFLFFMEPPTSIPYLYDKEFSMEDTASLMVKDISSNEGIYVPLEIPKALKMFKKDKNSKYLSQRNHLLMEADKFNQEYDALDLSLKPKMSVKQDFDLIVGSPYVCTPLRYELGCRNFFCVLGSSVHVKLYPPEDQRHLQVVADYEEMEFTSHENPWDEKFKNNKITPIEITVNPGHTLAIPPYWLYSFCLTKKTQICKFQYKTFFNMMSIMPYLGRQILQKSNTKYLIHERMEPRDTSIPIQKPHKRAKKDL